MAALAGFIYFRFIKKNEIHGKRSRFPVRWPSPYQGLANDLIKVLVGRSRPGLLLAEDIYGFKPFTDRYYYASFPSGHANTIAALCYGLYKVTGRFRWVWLTIALAVMASRVIVGAHFPSDVLFGAYLGVVVTELIAAAFEKKSKRDNTATRTGDRCSRRQRILRAFRQVLRGPDAIHQHWGHRSPL